VYGLQGFIEDLVGSARVEPASVDVAISNCVVNLSPDKPAVLASVYAALKEGGEFHFSDVFVDRRLSAAVRAHHILVRSRR
jgi:arsenite methyltransferase